MQTLKQVSRRLSRMFAKVNKIDDDDVLFSAFFNEIGETGITAFCNALRKAREDGMKQGTWLSDYLNLVEETEPPTIFQLWTGISSIAGVLGRKCYVQWGVGEHSFVYPNLYIVLVGPAGSRKGTAMRVGTKMLSQLGVPLAPDVSTKEALAIELLGSQKEMWQKTKEGQKYTLYSSLTAHCEELAAFLKVKDPDQILWMLNWYDNLDSWGSKTKTSGNVVLQRPSLNLLGCITPDKLNELPNEVVTGGWASRTLFIYAKGRKRRISFPIIPEAARLDLQTRLEAIYTIEGEFTISKEAVERYEYWYEVEDEITEAHSRKFAGYYARRASQVRKLSMIMSAAREDTHLITREDIEEAIRVLREAEGEMGRVFSGHGAAKDSNVLDQILYFIADNKKTTKTELIQVFHMDLPSQDPFGQLARWLAMAKKIGWIEMDGEDIVYTNMNGQEL